MNGGRDYFLRSKHCLGFPMGVALAAAWTKRLYAYDAISINTTISMLPSGHRIHGHFRPHVQQAFEYLSQHLPCLKTFETYCNMSSVKNASEHPLYMMIMMVGRWGFPTHGINHHHQPGLTSCSVGPSFSPKHPFHWSNVGTKLSQVAEPGLLYHSTATPILSPHASGLTSPWSPVARKTSRKAKWNIDVGGQHNHNALATFCICGGRDEFHAYLIFVAQKALNLQTWKLTLHCWATHLAT